MELRAGYKNTEIGVIPEDWDSVPMGEVGKTIIGLTYSPNDVAEYGTLVLMSSNVQQNQLKYENNVFVEMELPKRVIVKENDILICVRNGSKHLIGKCALIDKEAEGFAFGAFMSIYRSKYSKFIFYSFQSNGIQVQIDETMGATINQLTNKNLSEFQIPLPPLPEQTAIATVLSDTDNLLQALEKKIAKKRLIKQGAMQELLKPKEDWVMKSLGDIATMSSGGTPSTKNTEYYNGKILWVSISDITKAGKFIDDSLNKITGKGLLNSSAKIFSKNTVLLAMYASIGKCCIATSEMSTSQAILGIEVHKSLLNEYLYYFLLFNRVKLASQGQQGTQSNLNKGMVENINLPLPSIKEQTQIVTILSDMDTEIESLEKQLSKYKQVKQGVMQNLLTGKIRLV